jgi:hypothetical protein
MVPDKHHRKPEGAEAPLRPFCCIKCSHKNYVKGEWNELTGRWLMAFDCGYCGTHQEAFVSHVRTSEEEPKQNRIAFKDQ